MEIRQSKLNLGISMRILAVSSFTLDCSAKAKWIFIQAKGWVII